MPGALPNPEYEAVLRVFSPPFGASIPGGARIFRLRERPGSLDGSAPIAAQPRFSPNPILFHHVSQFYLQF
jgi:hypothetical protein